MSVTIIYFDNAAAQVDTQQIQDDYSGPLGQNWQWSNMTAAEAERWVANHLARGYSRGHYWGP